MKENLNNKDFIIKKLIYRSKYTGTKETDILLSNFVDAYIYDLTFEQLKTYQSILLAVKNIDLLILCVFLLGAIIGLFSIAKLIKMAFEQKRELLMSIFFGLILFCIPLIWMNDSNLTNEKLNLIHIILGGLVALLIVLLFNRFKQV